MKNCVIALVFLLICGTVCSQSYHFSQFFSTPLLSNPANTGFTEGPYRIATNFRTQGVAGENMYFTGYLSADISPLRNKLTPGHKAGVGMYIMNDHSLNSAIQTNSIGMSAAYHVGLDTYGEHSFGVGVQGTFNQRRINYGQLSFENQYGPGGYDGTLPVGERLAFNSKHFFDLNAGAIYNANLEDKAFFAGLGVYNLIRHNESIIGDEFQMPMRLTFQAGAQFYAGTNGKVYTSLTTMHQAKASELTLGGAYGHQLTEHEKNEITAGLWYRYQDAIIPYLGYEYNSFQVGISYDYNVSTVKTGAEIRNGYELTLLYKAKDKRQLKTLIPWY